MIVKTKNIIKFNRDIFAILKALLFKNEFSHHRFCSVYTIIIGTRGKAAR